MYVPPSVFVASAIGSALVNLVFSLGPFAILAYLTGVEPSLWWLFLIVPCLLVTLFAFGVGLILASMAVYFTDTVEIWAVLVTVYFYLTPVIYPASALGPVISVLEQYNPMYLYLNIARTVVIFGTRPAYHELGLATAFAIGACVIGWLIFTRLESRFAYHL
jgi:ABC-type polysaccharide/polyol phosphate export permease